MLRSLSIGLFIGILSYAAGNTLDLLGDYYPQLDVDSVEVAPVE